jgi:stress response protein YsnF
MKAIASLSSILKCKPSIANKHQEEIRELQQLMSSNPGFVRNVTRQEVERTSGRAFKLSKNSYEKTSDLIRIYLRKHQSLKKRQERLPGKEVRSIVNRN